MSHAARSIAVLGIALEGVEPANPDAKALVDVVRDLIAINAALEARIKKLEAETAAMKPYVGEDLGWPR